MIMNVSVTFIFSQPVSQSDLDSFKSAAQELTSNRRSIQVSIQDAEENYVVVTNFIMGTTAQYKVVDNISREFEFWTDNIKGYQDMSIQFPEN